MSIFDSMQIVQLESIEILPPETTVKEELKGKEPKEEDTEIKILPFECTLCPLKFDDKQKFRSHVQDHFKPITCKDCNKTFIGDKQYTYHLKHTHTNALNVVKDSSEDEEVFTTKGDSSNEDIAEDFNFDTVECTSVACDICGRLFPDISAVIRHSKTHTNEGKRFFCSVCNSGFNKKTNLEFHLRIHTNERPYKCEQCPKSFAHVSGLNCHRRVHTGERPYKCPFCTKSYAHSTDLRRHRRTHGYEEKRFTCDLCNKQFFENKFLKTHMRIHHRDRCFESSRVEPVTDQTTEEYIDYEYIHSD
ncbi:Zinc finger protein [Pseudolycoriella hygida]|uniref:Zinc finger protein n=1 Tax=Pseudolycoriella hygida TaxID=35572 RepID=A0A9Q0MS67_9DIPT|nr:Zinc finger protein [Pseudolycoriella hygida]